MNAKLKNDKAQIQKIADIFCEHLGIPTDLFIRIATEFTNEFNLGTDFNSKLEEEWLKFDVI